MKKLLYLFLLTILYPVSLLGNPFPYISPGITLSFNFNGYFIVSPKISIGLAENGRFYNITFGKAWSNDSSAYPHAFVEFQFGTQSPQIEFRKQMLFVGGGIGITIPSSKVKNNTSMRLTVFSGFIYFLNATVMLTEPVQSDIGVQIVLPLPIIEIHNLNG